MNELVPMTELTQAPEWIQIDDLVIHFSHVRHIWLNGDDGQVRIYFDACDNGLEDIWLVDESAERFRAWWATQALFEVVKL